MGRSQRHKVYIQAVAADGVWEAEGVPGNLAVAGANGGPLQGSLVPGPEPGVLGEDSSEGGSVPITATGPTTASIAAVGAVNRTIATLTVTGGTAPFTWTITTAAGVSANIAGNLLRTSVDPAGTAGVHNMVLNVEDDDGQNHPLSLAVTLT